MSGGSYGGSDRRYSSSKSLFSDDEAERERARRERERRVDTAKKSVHTKKTRETRGEVYDNKAVKLGITKPKAGAERIYLVCVDNSGSNRQIANHLKKSSGHLLAGLNAIDPQSQIAFNYFSDHCDYERIEQGVDYISPGPEGDVQLASSIAHVSDADGGDAPEAIECVLWNMSKLDFGDAKKRHLILVTDVVAHDMGMRELGHRDDGCPNQRDWRRSLDSAREAFTTIEVVGCSDDRQVGKLQEQFLTPDRRAYDLIDLSVISEHVHRLAITGNVILLLAARHRGLQAVEMFLSTLYEKWIDDPVFGHNTELRAKEAIRRFGKYLEAPKDEVERMMKRIII
ncbi:hypothetical protein KJ885_05415 [Patescibacteria group bacterium]|nr:hypothetical protein [Patescibacteria group bacterium]